MRGGWWFSRTGCCSRTGRSTIAASLARSCFKRRQDHEPVPNRAAGASLRVHGERSKTVNFLASLRTALRALRKNKLRSLLAMLGIVIAVAAVVATVAIGQGAEAKVANQMASLGTNLLVVQGGSIANHGVATGAGATQNLTRDDATAIERELGDSVAEVSPSSRTNGQVVYGDQNWSTQIQGASAAFLDIRSWTLAEGDVFTREDDSAAAKVCVLGQTVVDKLFAAGAQVIGEEIRVKA